jgi:hypothetical protein
MIECFRGWAGKTLWLGVVLFTACGCRTVPTRGTAVAAPRTTGSISQVVVLWSEAVLRQDNVPVAQGFAGKVYLFGPDSNASVTAPGKFTIYAYDDTATATNGQRTAHVKPDYTWELAESDLKDLLKKDAIGWSYSLWLPCGAPAPTERRYTLMVCFTPEKGPRALSESTLVTLPALRAAQSTTLAQSRSPRAATPGGSSSVKLVEKLVASP